MNLWVPISFLMKDLIEILIEFIDTRKTMEVFNDVPAVASTGDFKAGSWGGRYAPSQCLTR